jgi:2-desacetyl-2-hydroxyethyl bacteriochlorophyllide A dehydrogenase
MFQVKMKKPYEIVYEEGDAPIPKNGEAVIAVKANGICGSDLHRYTGHSPLGNPDSIIGHEYGGIIKRIEGRGSSLKAGMKAAVNPNIYCGQCYYCRNSLEHLCENMKGITGMAEEVSVPFENIVRLDPSFDMMLSPFIEPAACVIHSAGGIRDSNILIIGTGTVGLIEQQVLKLNGNKIATMDTTDHSRRLSKEMGADLVIDASDSDKTKILMEYSRDEKIDIVIDNVCTDETVDLAVKMVKKSGTVLIVGVCGKSLKIDHLSVLLKEVLLKTTFLFRHRDFIRAAELISSGLIDVRPLVTKVFPLKNAKEAFEYKLNTPSIKVVLET